MVIIDSIMLISAIVHNEEYFSQIMQFELKLVLNNDYCNYVLQRPGKTAQNNRFQFK